MTARTSGSPVMALCRGLPAGPALLAVLFLSSGTLHLARPAVFEGIVPPWLPAHRALVYVSGVAELACAAGLLHPRTRAAAGYASAALLVAVFPANVQMALDASRAGTAYRLVTYARLPLQVPLIGLALRAAGWRPRTKSGRAAGRAPDTLAR